MAAASKIPPHFSGRRNIFIIGQNSSEIKSAAALLQINTDNAIKGKSEGIIDFEHSESPRRTPMERFSPSKSKIIPIVTAQRAVKMFFLFKKIRLS